MITFLLADRSHTSYLTYLAECRCAVVVAAVDVVVVLVDALLLPVIIAVAHYQIALPMLLLSLSLFVVALMMPVIFAVGHDMSSRM